MRDEETRREARARLRATHPEAVHWALDLPLHVEEQEAIMDGSVAEEIRREVLGE